MADKLEKIQKFLGLSHDFQKIERVVRVVGEMKWENDMEHSWQLAMLAWYIIDSESLPLDKDKVLKIALVHDLVEVHAGDTYIFEEDPSLKESKDEREEKARLKLKRDFPEFEDMHLYIESYKKLSDEESRFVSALDKILPVLNIMADKGRTWRETGVTMEMLVRNKTPRVSISPVAEKYWKEIIRVFERKPDLFAKI